MQQKNDQKWLYNNLDGNVRDMKKLETSCEQYGRMRNKGKLSGQVPHCNFLFVHNKLVFLVKRFLFRFQFSN